MIDETLGTARIATDVTHATTATIVTGTAGKRGIAQRRMTETETVLEKGTRRRGIRQRHPLPMADPFRRTFLEKVSGPVTL